ncbi:helix-turn-helix domain-containing protein [Actinomycetospora sp. CA-053990]|uniref:helix-turn-helix domain-containing protein n=1 Tax=Actinomycetospora sp. CA-053990 TaxID=3239891 RepID=UPI003D91261C
MSLLLREAIGGSIRRARTERRRTLRDVSKEARVSLGYLSEIERGRKEPSSELLAAICEALSLPLPELLDEVADVLRPAPRPVPAGVGAGASRGFGDAPGVDAALRSAVEEAFEPATSGDDASAGMSARMSATLPTPPEPEEPAAPRTVALPEPEGLPQRDADEEVVAPVEGTTTVRLVGLAGGATSGPRSPVVRVAA